MEKSNFRTLIAWRKAMRLCVDVCEVTDTFPAREEFCLSIQLRRAAISVPSNIAEGRGRGTWRDYRRFLLNARGSLFELQTQLLIASARRYTTRANAERLVDASSEVARLINGLIRKITPTRYSLQPTR